MAEEIDGPCKEAVHRAIWDALHDTRGDIKEIRHTVSKNEYLLWAVTIFLAAQFGMEFLTGIGLGSVLGALCP